MYGLGEGRLGDLKCSAARSYADTGLPTENIVTVVIPRYTFHLLSDIKYLYYKQKQKMSNGHAGIWAIMIRDCEAAATGGGRSERGIYIMKELLFMKPIFKEAVWGWVLRDEFDTRYHRQIGNAGVLVPIKTVTVPLQREPIRENICQGCGQTTSELFWKW